jgi:formylglycine-generating enzyme required for sulfatase activity
MRPASTAAAGEIYLPEGYEPEGPAVADDGWPAALVRRQGGGPVRFVRIPGGSFSMGRVTNAQGQPVDPAAPARPVTLSGYYMQEFEVTNAEVEDGYNSLGVSLAKQPEEWRRSFEELIRQTDKTVARPHPAVMLSHLDAEFFARWARGRLPTEAQWEYAARSRGQDHQFVAGIDANKPLLPQANINSWGNGMLPTVPGDPQFFPNDRTQQGLRHLTGNVQEWCRDAWEPFVAAKAPLVDPAGPPRSAGAPAEFVIRGGSFKTLEDRGLTVERADHEAEDQAAPDLGFRLVIECPSAPAPTAPVAKAR